MFSHVRLVDHINIHGGGAVDKGAPVREKFRNQQSVFTDDINLQKRVQTSGFYCGFIGLCFKIKTQNTSITTLHQMPRDKFAFILCILCNPKGGEADELLLLDPDRQSTM